MIEEDVEILMDGEPKATASTPSPKSNPSLRAMALFILPILLLGLAGALTLTLLFCFNRRLATKFWRGTRVAAALSLSAFTAIFSPLFATTILLAYFTSRSDNPSPLAALFRSAFQNKK